MFAFLSMLFSRFMSARQRSEARAFEIYLQMLSKDYVVSEYELARSAIRCAKHFDQAIADDTLGIEDLPKLRHGLSTEKN